MENTTQQQIHPTIIILKGYTLGVVETTLGRMPKLSLICSKNTKVRMVWGASRTNAGT